MWIYRCHIYVKEIIVCVERIYGCLPKESTYIPVTDHHLELDATPLLGIDYNRKFQMFLGLMQWMVTIGNTRAFSSGFILEPL